MEKKARFTLLCTAAVLSALLVWAVSAQEEPAVPVQVAMAQQQDIYNSITVPGTVEAVQSLAAAPQTAATVLTVYVREGDIVREGETLCTLQPHTDAVPPVDSAALAALWQTVSQSGGETVPAASAQVLTAPCTGTVLSVPAAGQTVYGGVPCAVVANLSLLRIAAEIPELFAGEIDAGQRANITVPAAANRVYAAQVETVAPVAVQAVSLTGETGASSVRAVLPLRGSVDGLRPGYSVSAKIFTAHRADAVVVPYEAVRQQGTQQVVYVVEGGRACLRAVETGYQLETVCEITEGLAAGETVVLSPPDTLADGSAVAVNA